MAIDIKELHIGAHILADGKRERVRGLDEDNGLIIRFPAEYVLASDVEPIPITEGLLTELGFEKVTLHTRPKPIIQYIDAESIKAQAEDLDARVVPRITIQYINITNPYWSVSAYGKNMEENKAAIRYLHELEAFLYLTTKTELIKE